MALLNDGKIELQTLFISTTPVATSTHLRLKGEIMFLGDQQEYPWESEVKSVSWGAPNALTGTPLASSVEFDVPFDQAGTANISIIAVEIGVLSGSNFLKTAEIDLATIVFNVEGRYTLTNANINFL